MVILIQNFKNQKIKYNKTKDLSRAINMARASLYHIEDKGVIMAVMYYIERTLSPLLSTASY